MENKTIIHGYIPDRFRQYWQGKKAFPQVIPMTEWDNQQEKINKKRKRRLMLSRRENFAHRSRGGFNNRIYEEILDIINDSYNDDWYYDGEGEYQEKTFQPELAAKRITKLYAKWKHKL